MSPPIRFPRPGRRWIKPLLIASLANVVLWQAATFATVHRNVLAGHADFISFYTAAQIVASSDRARLYDVETQQLWQQRIAGLSTPLLYYRPPFHLLLYLPFAPLSLEAAYFAFYGVNLLLLLVLAWLLRPAAGVLGGSSRWTLLALAGFLPVSFVLLQGQDSLVALLVLALVWRALRAERELLAGVLLVLLLFKFQIALPMVAVFLLARRWKVMQGFAAGVLPVIAASVAVVGVRATLAYPAFLLEMSERAAYGTIHPWAMPNLRGLLESALVPQEWLRATLVIASLVLLWAVARVWRLEAAAKDAGLELRFAFMMVVVLLVSHHLNPHDITLLALPLLLVSDHLAKAARSAAQHRAAAVALIAILFLPTLYVLLLRWRALYLLAILLVFLAGAMGRELHASARRKGAQATAEPAPLAVESA